MIPLKFPTFRPLVAGLALLAAAELRAQLGTAARSVGQSATAALLSASATAAIRACAFEARNQLVFDIDSRLKSAAGAIGVLEETAKSLPPRDRDRLFSIFEDIRTQEAALKLHIATVPKASTETWPAIRDTLAYSYLDYVGAVSRAELAAAGEPASASTTGLPTARKENQP